MPDPCSPTTIQTAGGFDPYCGRASFPKQLAQLVAHNLHNLLVRRQLQQHFRPHSLRPHMRNKFIRHAHVHVAIQQRLAYLRKPRVQVLLRKLPLPPKILERPLQFLCKCFKHSVASNPVNAAAAIRSEVRVLASKEPGFDWQKF